MIGIDHSEPGKTALHQVYFSERCHCVRRLRLAFGTLHLSLVQEGYR